MRDVVDAQQLTRLLEGLVENPYMGIIIVNKEGKALIANQTYLDIIGKSEEEVLGRHCLEFTPNSRLHEILETGEVHLADYWPVNGHDTIVARFPIYFEEELLGAIGKSLFLELSEAQILVKKMVELEEELAWYRDAVSSVYQAKYCFDTIVGQNKDLQRLKSMAERLAKTGSTILITGESGTGKELFAHAIHQASPRAHAPFVRVNCVALPENLLESELFGYEEGAFTGARKGGKPGKFELAHRGTIFLDEIGDMPLSMQAKLLTVLQEREVERIGGTKPIRIDVQVLAATNRNLEELVKEGVFREDLYYRLNVVNLRIIPLRQRLDDIPLLVEALLPEINQRLRTRVEQVSPEAVQLLCSYQWPGNVRELENLLERAIILADLNDDNVLDEEHFPSLQKLAAQQGVSPRLVNRTLAEAVEQLEKEMIKKALRQTNNNKTQTAKVLGLHSSVLYRKLNKYDLA